MTTPRLRRWTAAAAVATVALLASCQLATLIGYEYRRDILEA